MNNNTVDWALITAVFLIFIIIVSYLWRKFGGKYSKYSVYVLLACTLGFTVFMNMGGRPGGVYIIG